MPYEGPSDAFRRVREKMLACCKTGHMQNEEKMEMFNKLVQLMIETKNVPVVELTEQSNETNTANMVLGDLMRKREAAVHSDEFKATFPSCAIAIAEQTAEEVRYSTQSRLARQQTENLQQSHTIICWCNLCSQTYQLHVYCNVGAISTHDLSYQRGVHALDMYILQCMQQFLS